MNDVWKPTTDFGLITKLHREWNRGIYCCLDEYSGLRSSDLRLRKARGWITTRRTGRQGFAIAIQHGSDTCFEELWAGTTGSPERGLPVVADDDLLLRETYELLTQASKGGVVLRFPSNNSLGVLLATRYHLRLETTLLLSTRTPAPIRPPRLPANNALRRFREGDETAYSEIHRECFGSLVSPEDYRRWARKPSCESFSAVSSGRVVGLLIAEIRRGGLIGDFNIAIREGHRQGGLGSALVAAGMRFFDRRAVEKVVADHWATNGRAVPFYERLGFDVERAYHFFRVRSA
jgi:ribosomal protein S18 acetylase RimI-like enzyme